jgi:hypothetical protein
MQKWLIQGLITSFHCMWPWGPAGENSKAKVIHESWDDGAFSYASFGFTAAS